MNKNILKYFGLAALLALGANAWAYTEMVTPPSDPGSYVAVVDGTKYCTSGYEAFQLVDKAHTGNSTIKLLKDVTADYIINYGTSVAVDLSGFRLCIGNTGGSSGCFFLFTIDDSVGGGRFEYDPGNFVGGKIVSVRGGTFKFDPTSVCADRRVVINNGDGSWTVRMGAAFIREAGGQSFEPLESPLTEEQKANEEFMSHVYVDMWKVDMNGGTSEAGDECPQYVNVNDGTVFVLQGYEGMMGSPYEDGYDMFPGWGYYIAYSAKWAFGNLEELGKSQSECLVVQKAADIEKGYLTLQSAVNAVAADAEITLLGDNVETVTGGTIPFTLRLNDYTYDKSKFTPATGWSLKDNGDGTMTYSEGGEVVEPETKVVVPDESEIKPVDEEGKEITGDDATKAVEAAKTAVEAIAGNTGAEMTEGTGVEAAVFTSGEEVKAEVAQGLNDQAKNVTKDDKGVELSQPEQQEVQEKVAAVSTSKDLSSYVKVDVKSPVVEVKESVATVKTLVYDVQPMAVTKVTTTVDSANPKTVTVEAPVEYNDAAKPITFRLPLTDAFTVSAIVTHEGDPDRLCMVQGAAGGRYVEVTASHFSLFTATPSEIIETTTESKTVLGIKRVDYTVTQTTADLAAAVPWLMAAEENMPVSGLITTGISEGDQIQVYEKSANAYYTWLYRDGEWEGATGTPSADEYPLERGRAFWYKPVGGKGASGTYTQVGLYSESTITSKVDSAAVASASFANPVHFLMASPKYEDFNLKEKLTADADCKVDDVAVVVATGARYRFNGSAWGQDVDQEVDIFGVKVSQKVFVPTEGEVIVPAGTAFWYLSAGGAPEFEW